MTSTQRVEGINAIIKKYVNTQSSLMDFFQGIQEFLHNQTTKSEYRDWIESLLCQHQHHNEFFHT